MGRRFDKVQIQNSLFNIKNSYKMLTEYYYNVINKYEEGDLNENNKSS